jgi:hypothetical protein
VASDDIACPDLSELDWTAERRSESLTTVFAHAVNFAKATEKWYADKRRPKRVWGRILRVGAIVLGTIAAVVPILGQIYTHDGKAVIAPGWASIALVGAAALVALDRYFGFSAGWMRFMSTGLRVTRLRLDFEYSWHAARIAAAAPPTDAELRDLLDQARGFVLAVADAIEVETGAWVTDFQSSLARAEVVSGRSKDS